MQQSWNSQFASHQSSITRNGRKEITQINFPETYAFLNVSDFNECYTANTPQGVSNLGPQKELNSTRSDCCRIGSN